MRVKIERVFEKSCIVECFKGEVWITLARNKDILLLPGDYIRIRKGKNIVVHSLISSDYFITYA